MTSYNLQKPQVFLEKVVMSVVSHNQIELVEQLLSDLDGKLLFSEYEFEVVITHNLPCQIQMAKGFSFNVKEVFNLSAKGFGDNHNCVFENNRCDFFMVVNPDIKIIEKIHLTSLLKHARMGHISSPVIMTETGEVDDFKREIPNPINLLKRHIFRDSQETHNFWLAGMFLVFSTRSFVDLKGFDRRYFMYVEDCDLCYRARSMGMPITVLENTSVVHGAQRASRKRLTPFMQHVLSLMKFWFRNKRR